MRLGRLINGLRYRVNEYGTLVRFFWRTGELSRLPSAKVMLVCCDANRGYVYAGKRYAQLLDSINERFTEAGIDTVTVAAPYSIVFGKRAFGSVAGVNGEFARADIRRRLWRLLRADAASECAPVVTTWQRVLDRIQPAVIIAIQPSIELCLAARDRGVWIADLQHGILGDEGYYGRAYRARYGQAGWADCILCWDERSARFIRSQAPDAVDTKVIGNPWFLRFLWPAAGDKLVAEAASRSPAQGSRVTILVTLQWGLERYGKYHETGMPAALVNFIHRRSGEYDWWLRIHPMMLQEPARTGMFRVLEREFGTHKNVSWKACSEAALPVVLREVDLHVTAHSAVTIEAAWFGVPSALLDERRNLLAEWLGEQISSGLAEIIPPEFESIRLWVERRARQTGGRRFPCYMSPESLDAFINEVRRRIAAPRSDRAVRRAA